jgi:hypothetical protein
VELVLERTKSEAGTIPEQGSIRPPHARWQKPEPASNGYVSTCGAPDISCADIPEEQLLRTYSRSSVWDPQTNPVPPMQEMEGFGRFRRSVHADAAWEVNKFGGDLQALGPVALQKLGEFEIAGLKEGVMKHIRTPSFASLASRSDSDDGCTNPRICRGFTSTQVSPVRKSSQDRSRSGSRARSRATSPDASEGTCGQLQTQPKRTSFICFDVGPPPLETINESADVRKKKKVVPLIFGAQGTADEVIDDDDYESCEESFVPTAGPTKTNAQGPTTAAANWYEKKAEVPQIVLPTRHRGARHHRAVEHVAEKARGGQKKSTKPVARRLSSRGAKAANNRVTIKENICRAVEAKSLMDSALPLAFSPQALSTNSNDSVESKSADDGLHMANQKTPTRALKKAEDASHLTVRAVNPGIPRHARVYKAHGRVRSNTAIRVQSGNIPIIYLEGDMKRCLNVEEVEGKNLQLVPA